MTIEICSRPESDSVPPSELKDAQKGATKSPKLETDAKRNNETMKSPRTLENVLCDY